MRKLLIVSILLALVASSGAFAASTRWNALGGDHRFVIDTTNYTVYAGRVTLFGNALFVIPVSKFLDNNGVHGALFNVKDMVLAYQYNIPSAGAKNLRTALAGFAETNSRLASLEIKPFPDLAWGIKKGNTSFGVRLAAAMDGGSDEATVVEEEILNEKGDAVGMVTGPVDEITTSAKALDLSLGATMYKTPAGDLDLGLRAGIQSFKEENPNHADADIEGTGGLDLSFDARLHKPLSEDWVLVPVANLNYGALPSAEYHEVFVPSVVDVSYMKGDIGVGLRRKVKEKGQALVAVVGAYSSTKNENPATTIEKKEGREIVAREKKESLDTTDSSLGATVLAGCEFPITSWLIVRGGARVKFASVTDEMVVQTETEDWLKDEETVEEEVRVKNSKSVNYYYNMGFRTIYRGVIIDILLARNILHRGPYFLSGSTGDLATSVCVTYKF